MTADLEAEFLRIEPRARLVESVVGYRLWHAVTVTPAHRYDHVLAIHVTGHALSVRCRRGFDHELARTLLLHLHAQESPSFSTDSLTVVDGLVLAGRSFNTVAHVPAPVASLYQHESPDLNRATAWVLPAHACEFRTGHDRAAFWFAIRDGQIDVLDWLREPTPLIRAQLLSPWPGGMLRHTKRPLFLSYSTLTYLLPALPMSVSGLRLLSVWDTDVLVRRVTTATFSIRALQSGGSRSETVVSEDQVVAVVRSILLADPFLHPAGV